MDIETKLKNVIEKMDNLEKPKLKRSVAVVSKPVPAVHDRYDSSKKLFVKSKDK
tara:strand:+ start:369 stop:530 length:162 start_codon:yes stop_codon:yes gene_type:complete